ncbi:MAG: VOC family protein [bacterium]|nr:VOC family protein [Rhodocyclaceae bacterium]MCA4901764.1 VOC family protein [Rhodocyclaceae bacterium]MCE2979048.1 VOC family protein [Betaproteobacteria bacterium]
MPASPPTEPGPTSPEEFGLAFHHLGLAVRTPGRAQAFLRALGYRSGAPVLDPEQNVHLIWAEHPRMPAVELVYPTDTPGPVTELLARQGESIYHACFEAEDVAAALARMKAAGHRAVCVREERPAILFGGRLVSFHFVAGFGLIELLATAPPRGEAG